ncbi:MAG: CRISPR-associated protein Cas4, partial [Candidatus Bipolaricaulaceae bacterium]
EREGRLVPVEYKRGKAKVCESDRVHLALIALCLEEMTRSPIPFGFLFYFGSRRRVQVPLTSELRRTAVHAVQGARELLAQGSPPLAHPGPRCRGCALEQACLRSTAPFSWEEWLA